MIFCDYNQLTQRIFGAMPFDPTDSQRRAVGALAEFMLSTATRPTLLINGYAGTGKTSLMRAFCDVASSLKAQLVLMAPTGRAAKVLASATGRRAMTIHKTIYRQERAGEFDGSFNLNFNRHNDTIFIVDEASMISDTATGETAFGSGRLLTDLVSYVFSRDNCRLLLIGDPAQMPPVGFNEAPALDTSVLERMGLDLATVWLTDIMRQENTSTILTNASTLREIIDNDPEFMGYPPLCAAQGTDVERIGGAELIETLISCYDKYGTDNTIVITRSNKRANRFNQGIRSAVMFKEEEITRGDLLMIGKNNYMWMGKEDDFIANGDIAEVVSIRGYNQMYGMRFANVSLKFKEHDDVDVDAKIMLDVLNSDFARLTHDDEQRLYQSVSQDYMDVTEMRKRISAMRSDPWLNALQVKFAYAITCHKAQGGQWDAVFVDVGYVAEEQMTTEFLKWLYTAFTRAREKLYLVNFKDDYFD